LNPMCPITIYIYTPYTFTRKKTHDTYINNMIILCPDAVSPRSLQFYLYRPVHSNYNRLSWFDLSGPVTTYTDYKSSLNTMDSMTCILTQLRQPYLSLCPTNLKLGAIPSRTPLVCITHLDIDMRPTSTIPYYYAVL
jgi:hypothetical protein